MGVTLRNLIKLTKHNHPNPYINLYKRHFHFTRAAAYPLSIETTTAGDGKNFPKPGQTVSMHYTGTLTNGDKFDSSRDRGAPFVCKIGVGQLIKGWDEGVPQMSVGQRAKLTCTPDYAYGPRGIPGVIPPNATLVFDVELIKIH